MVDCRQSAGVGAGAAPIELAHANGTVASPHDNNHHTQAGGSGDMPAHALPSSASVRASTPAANANNAIPAIPAIPAYTGGMNPVPPNMSMMGMGYVGSPPPGAGLQGGGAGGCGYMCGMKGLMWYAPHAPPPPPSHPVNPHVYKSVQANGADLPMNDIPTLRYYFNLGVECMWAAYGPPPPPPPPTMMPPRHYSARDLAQDMQQVCLNDRPSMNQHGETHNKHKQAPSNDKQLNNQGKGNGQRPLLGPRFKRGGNNQDNNQNNHNKGQHNNMGNKGPNNRRNNEVRNPLPQQYSEECEAPLLPLPYIPYPPPSAIYPVHYYPLESEPAMLGMMGGMSYVGYDEGVEYGAPVHYYPTYPPPHAAHATHATHAPHAPPTHAQHQQEHK